MKAFVLPQSESLVQINCDNYDEVILVSGLCMNSEIDGWRRFGLTIIMQWDVYQYIAYNGLKAIYDKEFVPCIYPEDYDN